MFREHRERYMERVGNALSIIPGARRINGNVPFRQDASFYYLTGFEEPDAICVLAPNHPEHHFILFVQEKDRTQEQWTGPRSGIAGAVRDYEADAAFPYGKFGDKIKEYSKNASAIHYRLGLNETMDGQILELFLKLAESKASGGKQGLNVFVDPRSDLHGVRLVKDREEVSRIRTACGITCDALQSAMRLTQPGMKECEVEAIIAGHFLSKGSRMAFPAIVASGPNATILHYEENSRVLEEQDLVLVDVGAEHAHYASDVTRTFPVSGRFTPTQREVYQAVLDARSAALTAIGPGEKLSEAHRRATQSLTHSLKGMGILQGSLRSLVKSKAASPYYPHNTSHWLGLDVHDPGPNSRSDPEPILAPGMVITVEPGLYFQRKDRTVQKNLRGVGVRIEDDVLITSSGYEVLTPMPLDVEEIEKGRFHP